MSQQNTDRVLQHSIESHTMTKWALFLGCKIGQSMKITQFKSRVGEDVAKRES